MGVQFGTHIWIEEKPTHHTAACTVRPILTSPAASLNATPTLGCAAFPRPPSCPEHVWWAEQVLIAISVMRKPRGKKILVSREAIGLSTLHPWPDVGYMGMLCMVGLVVFGVVSPYRRQMWWWPCCVCTMGCMADNEENAELTMQDGSSCAAN
jgi:hypothetical protein